MLLKRLLIFVQIIFVIALFTGCSSGGSDNSGVGLLIADHSVARLSVLESIPDSSINNAKAKLHIAYGHTSHGSQIVDGMSGLVAFMNGRGSTNNIFSVIDLKCDMGDYGSTYGAYDLNQPAYGDWATATRNYLSSHSDINVVIWSWCAGVSHAAETDITDYLNLMNGLEQDYPNITFVYMTGHLDGTGLSGNLHLRNEQIRKYCRDNNKVLFDFADIETYDPDGTYFGDKNPTDACNYDGGNWAAEWRDLHAENVDWYDCSAAHSDALNANMKAYAFWWLMTRIAEM